MGFALSNMTLSSPAFRDGEAIPRKFTSEGEDVSPALNWKNVPEGTRSFALICHDPDAPLLAQGSYGFVHWVLYNIPGSATGLDEASDDYTCGVNNFDEEAYGGPKPPEGHGVHRYYFWLFALDDDTHRDFGLTLRELLESIEPHVIGMNRLVGTFER